ncbi:MAG: hypothetical protein JST73_00305 [Actinobacteria bacterium]|nr:hypothetical protein [Actinomycetota bacterium]
MVVLGAVVWTFWIAPFIVAGVIALLAVLGIGYLVKVVRPQYPPGKFPLPGPLRRR